MNGGVSLEEKLIKRSTEHYEFYFYKESIAERDIDKIIKIQESCYNEICTFLDVKPNFKIQYYLLDAPEKVGEVYGDNEPCNGFASPPDTIYAVYNDEVRCIGHHEDAHIISYTINRPQSNYIREGLAMYFDKVWLGKSNEVWVREFVEKGEYVSISNLLTKQGFFSYPESVTYPITGAFTKYLIESYGVELYLTLYKKSMDDVAEMIKEVYRKDIVELEDY